MSRGASLDAVFDLDGTLIDSAPGIVRSIRHAYAEVDIEPPPFDDLRTWIGPPIRERLGTELGSRGAEVVEVARSAFRAHYDAHGATGCEPFEGIPALLAALESSGARIAIATSKPEPLARAVLDDLGMADRFVGVAAPADGHTRVPKQELLARLVSNPDQLVGIPMIGDRRDDIHAGRHHEMRPIGVAWGYGSRDELIDAGAAAVVDHPFTLSQMIGDA